jgi:hypothetical protein
MGVDDKHYYRAVAQLLALDPAFEIDLVLMALPRRLRMPRLQSTICIAVPHNQMMAVPTVPLQACQCA